MRATLISLILLLGFAAPAQAGWRERRATEVAQIVWHHPCVDRMQIRRETRRLAIAEGHIGDYGAVAWADDDACVVYVSADSRTTWPQFCTRVLHEAGHLAQFRDPTNTDDPAHSSNPRSVMFATEGAYGTIHQHGRAREAGGDPRCADRGRPYLERHGALRG